MKLGEYKKLIPDSCYKIDNYKSLLVFIRVFLTIIILSFISYCISTLNLPKELILVLRISMLLFQALAIVGFFVIGHDCGHYSFHTNKKVNDLVGVLVFTPLLNSFYAWRKFHNYHHTNTQVKGIDPDWPELLLTDEELKKARIDEKLAINIGLGTPIGLLIGFWVGMVKRLFFSIFIPSLKLNKSKRNKLLIQNLFCSILSIVFVYFLYKTLGPSHFYWLYLFPAIIAATIGAFLTWIQHTQDESFVFSKENYDPYLAQVMSSYNIHFPRILEWFWLDINIHMPHHVSTRIPWYNLKNALETLKKIKPESIQEEKFSLKMVFKNFKLTRLKQVNNKNYWKLSRKYD